MHDSLTTSIMNLQDLTESDAAILIDSLAQTETETPAKRARLEDSVLTGDDRIRLRIGSNL